jgi:DNA (cytosine-5)-methyltransferase 1
MTRPRLLDLFSGAGGAAVGYHRAGFDVTGVDNRPQPRYPFEFHQGDAMTWPLDGWDAIHASPPCQDHSITQNFTTRRHGSGWMLAATRDRLAAQPVPWVIENVPGATMRADFKLCACMFDGLRTDVMMLQRERWFETSWRGFDMRPPCFHALPAVSVAGHDVPSHQRKFGRSVSLAERKQAMGIDWMNRDELSQAIPPAYTEHIGTALLAHLRERAV